MVNVPYSAWVSIYVPPGGDRMGAWVFHRSRQQFRSKSRPWSYGEYFDEHDSIVEDNDAVLQLEEAQDAEPDDTWPQRAVAEPQLVRLLLNPETLHDRDVER